MITEGTDGPWAFRDPWTITHARHAVTDDHRAAILEEAAAALTLLRSPMRLGDGLAEFHAMVSLLGQIHAWLPVVVAGARDQGHGWDDIAGQLGVTPAAARRRYSPHIKRTNKAR